MFLLYLAQTINSFKYLTFIQVWKVIVMSHNSWALFVYGESRGIHLTTQLLRWSRRIPHRLWRTIAQTEVKWQENHLAFRTRKTQKQGECKLRQNNVRASGWQRFRHAQNTARLSNQKWQESVVAMRRQRAESLQVKCLTQLDTSLHSFWLAYTYLYTQKVSKTK